MKKLIGHLKTVITHRAWVRYYCNKAGIVWQGLTHDLSKFHPVEFFESVKYWQGKRSPIDACKEQNGYSVAWFHHRGRNKHHMEYWTDRYDTGTSCVAMPYKYAVELVCDWLGAGRAYGGDSFTYAGELEWLERKLESGIKMHPVTANFVYLVFSALAEYSSDEYVFKHLHFYYTCAASYMSKYSVVFWGTSKDYAEDF